MENLTSKDQVLKMMGDNEETSKKVEDGINALPPPLSLETKSRLHLKRVAGQFNNIIGNRHVYYP
jgi:hypothetical protein